MKTLPIKYFLFPDRISKKRIELLKTIIIGQIKIHDNYLKNGNKGLFIEDWIHSLVFDSIFELNKIGVVSDEDLEKWILDPTGICYPEFKEF